MNTSSSKIDQLNAIIFKMLQCLMNILNFEVELQCHFDSDGSDHATSKAVAYNVISYCLPDFGDFLIKTNGSMEEQIDHELMECFMVITAPIEVQLPKPLHNIFVKHCSSVLFDSKLDYFGCVATMKFNFWDEDPVILLLSEAVKEIQLDAFTETTLRPNAAALIEDLIQYLPWFDYAASLANQMTDTTCRKGLIEDMNLLLHYLSFGYELNFAKMTSLCDVAGSLVPVRSLILSRLPSFTP